MRKFQSAVLAMVLGATGAFAQDGFLGVGVAGVGLFPVGDFEHAAGFGYGALGSVEIGGPGLSLTARAGYIEHLERADYTWSFIPIMGGLKLSTDDRTVYLAGELGPVLTKARYSGAALLGEDRNETNFGWSAGIGSEAGPLDLRFLLSVRDVSNLSETMSLGTSLGITFRQ
jgi:hypothetical protein